MQVKQDADKEEPKGVGQDGRRDSRRQSTRLLCGLLLLALLLVLQQLPRLR